MHHLIKRAGEFLAPFIAVSLLATLSAVPAGAVTESQVHADHVPPSGVTPMEHFSMRDHLLI